MPISRVPVVHKFGILSQGQARGILRQAVEEESKKRRQQSKEKVRSPLCIDWNFVEKFAVSDGAERRTLEAAGKRALQQLKYKLKSIQDTDVHSSPKKTAQFLQDPVDVSALWYEMVFLCQCEGSLQSEALLLLCSSLNCAPLSSAHIPCLMYVASLGYRWLKSDDISEEFLKTGEVTLLRVLFLASLRLYCHILTGDMKRLLPAQEGEQFKSDFDGFHMREEMYTKFPDAHFYWRVIFLVGEAMCHLVRGEDVPVWLTREGGPHFPSLLWHALDTWKAAKQSHHQLMASLEHYLSCTPLPHKEQILEGVLALGILALAAKGSCEVLSVLQVAAYGVEKLDKVTSMASLLGEKMHSSRHYGHSWVKTEDAVVKGDVNILGHQMAFKEEDQSSVTASSSYLMDEDEVPPASHSCKNSASAASGSPPRHGDGSEGGRDSRMVSKSASPSGKDNGKGGEACAAKKHVVLGLNEDLMSSIRDMSSTHKLNEYSKSASRSLPSKYTVSSMQSQYAVSEGPLEDGTTFLGSIAPSTVFNRSPSSTPNTLKDMMFDEDSDAQLCHAFFDYPWELAVAFCCNCTSLVTHGRLSKVQEQALQGCPLPVFGGQDKQSRPVLPRRSRRVFGLSQLTHYQGMRSVDGDASEDHTAWKVRFAAARGLSLVSCVCKSQTAKDGFSTVACEKLEELRDKERDRRVLDGLRVGQVLSQSDGNPDDGLAIYDVLAAHLVQVFMADSSNSDSYLPGSSSASRCLTSGTELTTMSGEREPKKATGRSSSKSKEGEKWKNPAPRVSSHWTQKLKRPPTFDSRTTGALNAIAEEHWKRWQEAEADRETAAAEHSTHEDAQEED